MLTNAHVSLGSQPQYLPHDSFAQTPPSNVTIASINKPTSKVFSFIIVISDNVCFSLFLLAELVKIISQSAINPRIDPKEKNPYDAVIIVKTEGETLKGRYLKEESGKEASFYAIINDKPKFTSDKEANFSLDGKYKTVFRPENPYPGLGIFNQKDNKISGTFRKNNLWLMSSLFNSTNHFK